MIRAIASIERAATVDTGAPKTHCYLITVVTRNFDLFQFFVSTAQARRLGFASLRTGGRDQTLEGWWYPTTKEFSLN